MSALEIEPNIASPDEFYEALLDAHRCLAPAQSQALNARLILLLANHIGDHDVLREALRRARLASPVASPRAADRSTFPPDEEGQS